MQEKLDEIGEIRLTVSHLSLIESVSKHIWQRCPMRKTGKSKLSTGVLVRMKNLRNFVSKKNKLAVWVLGRGRGGRPDQSYTTYH